MDKYVYACFAGSGKTTLSKENNNYVDIDSGDYHWLQGKEVNMVGGSNIERVKNPDFPENYLNKMREILADNKNVLVSPQPIVLSALREAKDIPVIVVVPSLSDKESFKERYIARGNSEKFINDRIGNFELFISNILKEDFVQDKIIIPEGLYLSDILK